MRIVISGASGFLGAPLVSALRQAGHDATALVRRPAGDGESQWDPRNGLVDLDLVATADVVVNLSGAPIAQFPRTRSRAREIIASRQTTTSTLAEAVVAAGARPHLVNASGMSWYGTDRGDDVLTEDAQALGGGFLADVARAWEDYTAPAAAAGADVTWLRTSLALDGSGGLLKLMKIPFRLGLGARLGSGDQYFSVISRADWVRAVVFVIENRLTGPVNLASPEPVTNREFTKTFGRVVHRPAKLVAPAFVLRAALRSQADDLLGSLRIVPQRLLDAGFSFRSPTVEDALADGLTGQH